MMNREVSLHNRGATTIRTDYNPTGDSRPHDICRSPTYIYQPILGSSKTRTGPRHPRTQYSTIPAQGHVGTRYSRHLSTPSARLAILVIESPSTGLPEYVVSTTNSHLMQFNNGRALIDTGGKNPLTRPPCLVAHTHQVARSRFITPHSHITC